MVVRLVLSKPRAGTWAKRNLFRVVISMAILSAVVATVLIAQQPVAQGPQASNAAAWLSSVTTWGSGTLGAMANYGTSPGAVLVPGVNAFITNTPAVTISGTPTVSFGPVSTSGGAFTQYHNSSAAAANVKASAGNLYLLDLGNSGTVPCWLQTFNNAGTPTAGTSVIDSFMVQAGTARTISPGAIALKNYTTGIAYAGATADSGATTTGCTTTFSVSIYYQ